METIIIQNWTTIDGSDTTPFVQDVHDWLDASGYVDWTFWLDVAEAPGGANSMTLAYEAAPTRDELSFQAVASVTMAAGSSPLVSRVLLNRTLGIGVTRFLRYRVTPASAPWSTTFRIVASASRVEGGAFVPTQLSGCVLSLRSDIGITLVNGSVSAWSDQSNQANHASQGTSTRRPGYNIVRINGFPTVQLDASSAGNEQYLTLASSLNGLTAGHVFLVNRRSSAVPPSGTRAGLWRLGTSGSAAHVPYTDNVIYDDCGSTTRYTCGTPVAALDAAHCYEIMSASGSWTSFINGVQQATSAVNTVGFATSPELGGNSAINTWYDGSFAELILYNRILTADEHTTLTHYLNRRYRLTVT